MKLSKFTTRLLCACFVVVLSTTLAMAQIDHNPATSGKTPPAQSKSRKQRLPTGPSTTKAPAGTKSTTADKAPAPDPSKPAVTTVEKTTPESELKPAEANESLTPEENKETETAKPSDTKTSDAKSGKDSDSSKASTKASDSIPELRDQIESADNPQEKAELQFKLVQLLLANGSKQEAINELHVMANEDRFDPQGLYNIGNSLARLGDNTGAILAYRRAIEQRKGHYSKASNNMGVIQLRQGRWDEAYESFTTALRLENFRYAEASYNLGRLYAARGENDLAIREWHRALKVNPQHKEAAQALSKMGAADQIEVSSLPKYLEPPHVSSSASSNRTTLTTRPTKVTPNPAATNALTVDPETYSYLQRARSARERDRQEEAVTNYRKVISRMGGYFGPANLELGYTLIALKRTDDAIANLLMVTRRDGARYPLSYYHLARLYELRGELRLAEENYGLAATTYKKENEQFMLDVSRVREKLGDYQGALTTLEEYVAMMERKHLKPDWSDERLSALRQKVAASQSKP
jgi:tetratricopeptide (TPR) repeat protein